VQAEHELEGCWIAGFWERRHGSHCACRLLAACAGAEPSAVDYEFCRRVLQKRWRMSCDHIPQVRRTRVTPNLPPHDPHDAIQLLLIANADAPSD
jgi:hypothetical protein